MEIRLLYDSLNQLREASPIARKGSGERALGLLRMRQRPFYNTRHTYISTLLSLGKPTGFVAKVGCSATVIEKHYP